MFTIMLIAAFVAIGLGVPFIVWLTKKAWRPNEKEEAIHHGVDDARRRIDRIPH